MTELRLVFLNLFNSENIKMKELVKILNIIIMWASVFGLVLTFMALPSFIENEDLVGVLMDVFFFFMCVFCLMRYTYSEFKYYSGLDYINKLLGDEEDD